MSAITENRWVRLLLVVFIVLVVQLSLVAELRVAGAIGDVMALFAVCAAVVAGPSTGAVAAFVIGIAFDLVLQGPFGLSALAYSLVAWWTARVYGGVLRPTWWLAMATAALGTAGVVVVYALVSGLVGEDWWLGGRLPVVIVVESMLNALLAPAALRILRWVFGNEDRRRLTAAS